MRGPWVAGFLLSCACFLAACSSPPVHVAVPSGWKPVSYRGLTIDVPATWPIYQRSKEPCGITGPGVLVGPPARGEYRCPAILALSRGPVVILGGPSGIMRAAPEKHLTINGVEVAESTNAIHGIDGGRQVWSVEEVVLFPGRSVWLDAQESNRRQPTMPAVVAEVVATMRPA